MRDTLYIIFCHSKNQLLFFRGGNTMGTADRIGVEHNIMNYYKKTRHLLRIWVNFEFEV